MAQVFQAQLQEQPLASYVWDLNDPGAPETTLVPSSQITALNFNLKARPCAPMMSATRAMLRLCTRIARAAAHAAAT